MRTRFLLIALVVVLFFSCKKDNSKILSPVELKGAWRMVLVKENATGSTASKPDSILRNVDITFTPINDNGGTFEGYTPTNTISPSDYIISAKNALQIPALNMTKVNETPWGYEFVNNIRDANSYNFESDGKLDIITTNKTLIFQKL